MNRWLVMGGVVAAGLAVALLRVKVSREVVIAASAYDVGQQISDTGNWKSWRPGIGGAEIESRTPASVVYARGLTLALAPAGDDRHTRVRWTAKAGVGGWFTMGAALGRLKEMLEDPASWLDLDGWQPVKTKTLGSPPPLPRPVGDPGSPDLRAVCEQTGTSIEWLVTGRGAREAHPTGIRDNVPAYQSNGPREPLNGQLLEGILLAVQEELRNVGLELPLLKQSMLVVTLYELCHERKEVDREAVARLVKLAG